jgi:hemerythrin
MKESKDDLNVAFLEWEPKYSVQNAEIDRQHQAWFALISGVHRAFLNVAGKGILRTVLAETTQYTFLQFAHEEKLMCEIDYPDRQQHILEHQQLAKRAREFADRFEGGQNPTTLEYLVFLADWVKDHTMTTDRELGQYLLVHSTD